MELNPVAAGIVDTPDAYRWSSARFHLDGRVRRDELVRDLEKRTGRRPVPRKGGWPKGRKRGRRGN